MKTLIFFAICSLALMCFSGCAYRGNVTIYSPSNGAMVDKATQLDSNVGLK